MKKLLILVTAMVLNLCACSQMLLHTMTPKPPAPPSEADCNNMQQAVARLTELKDRHVSQEQAKAQVFQGYGGANTNLKSGIDTIVQLVWFDKAFQNTTPTENGYRAAEMCRRNIFTTPGDPAHQVLDVAPQNTGHPDTDLMWCNTPVRITVSQCRSIVANTNGSATMNNPAPISSSPQQPTGVVYISQLDARFQPDEANKTGAADASCAQLMDQLSKRYGRGGICEPIVRNGVDMSDVMKIVFVTLDGTSRIPLTIEADPTSTEFSYRPSEVNMIAMEIQQGAGKTDAEWVRFLAEKRYREQTAELDYEQSVIENGGTVIDDKHDNTKVTLALITLFRKYVTDAYHSSAGIADANSGTSAAPSGARFALQLGVFLDDASARTWAGKLKAAGVPAYTERRKQADGSSQTLLRAGPFPDRASASAAIAKLRAAGLLPGSATSGSGQ